MSGSIPETMKAMVLDSQGQPLRYKERPTPEPGPGQILIKVSACGICRTDLHIVDSELKHPRLPLIPGHEIVGRVIGAGPGVTGFPIGDRVGVAWLGSTCGICTYCMKGRENLCDNGLFTGYTLNGGYAQYSVADQRYSFHLPENMTDIEAAPLLCAGLIGYRTYKLAGEAEKIGIYGFGAAAHIIAQIAVQLGRKIFAFTRPGDTETQQFALRLGAAWAGDSTEMPPEKLDAALIFAPVGPLVVQALQATDKGGTVVCGGIHMSDIPSFPYSRLWEERTIRSVANLTREDGFEFFEIVKKFPVRTEVTPYPLDQANQALDDLRCGRLRGAAVLVMG